VAQYDTSSLFLLSLPLALQLLTLVLLPAPGLCIKHPRLLSKFKPTLVHSIFQQNRLGCFQWQKRKSQMAPGLLMDLTWETAARCSLLPDTKSHHLRSLIRRCLRHFISRRREMNANYLYVKKSFYVCDAKRNRDSVKAL
jgi:hypothetical protein